MNMALGTRDNPYTRCTVTEVNAGRCRYKFCRCADCGIVARCEPHRDFYSKEDDDQLRCEPCFKKSVGVEQLRWYKLF